MAQVAVADKTDEVTKVEESLEGLMLTGKVLTGDARLSQRPICERVTNKGGDYLFVVNGDQPQLLEDIGRSFADYWRLGDRIREGRLLDEHGNRIHEWRWQASTLLEGYSRWPGLGQVRKRERTTSNKRGGEGSREVADAITALGPEHVSPKELLKIGRGHWHMENRLHWDGGVTVDEERWQIRAGHIAHVMAAFGNAAISLMRLMGANNLAAACRGFAAQPGLAVAAVGLDPGE
ncbi:MAG TPA: ISAs1 family transposase [Blastocatellia bacterium]|nr:ISAs1 family transposase [Blastocatellia bacterium]